MARFTRLQVLNQISAEGFVPLFYNSEFEICRQLIQICYDSGVRIFEFTNRGDFAHEIFAQLSKWAAKECPDMILGVGSVVDSGTCSLYIQSGVNFIVSPLLNQEMAKVCNRRKIAWIPGCATVSEINFAEELGAEIVKIFPAQEMGGPSFIKSLKGPCPWSSIMPSGGVSTAYENIKSWFDAGAFCVGMGSGLFPSELIKAKNWDEIARLVVLVKENVKRARN
ncbi:MAG: bifunctional 4-hydroxy-2-oxoglutarate aldolase/2-dehydro-3-deoxy-phosphogluconate aldolase [Bacteroidales bacterium]